jgi:NAD+ synthase (glutamine-hydrolysing)
MFNVRMAGAVLNQTPLDWTNNIANIRGAIADARQRGVTLLCLPEMCIPGYGCEDTFHSVALHRTCLEILDELLPLTEGMIVSFGLPLAYQNAVFNSACLAANGKIMGFVAKRFLAGDGIHYEPRWFKPWPAGARTEISVLGERVPLGDLVFNAGDLRIGFEICEDAWVAKRPGGTLALEGVDVILNPSASHFAFGKMETRKRFVLEGSRAFGVTYIYSNLLGNEAGRAIYDGGTLIAHGGRLVAQGPRFTFDGFVVTDAVVDVETSRAGQMRTASFMPTLDEDDRAEIEIPFQHPGIAPEIKALARAEWEASATLKEEEFSRAETLGLFDYLRKSRSQGFVVSLSGGADSAGVCTLVALTFERVLAEKGAAFLAERLSYIKGIGEICARETPAILRALFTTVYQPTENSTSAARESAEALARGLNSTHYTFKVGALVKGYVDMVQEQLGRELTWETDDVALQNIQARARAPGVWMLANVRNALLLTTSDRSEAAVGYATMDGDTCGGLAPIAGIDKHFLRQWLAWMEKQGPRGLRAVAELHYVNQMQPSPELRPQSMQQTAEGDLMPYDVLDAAERAFIRDKKMPADVFEQLRAQFPQHDAATLKVWVTRFFTLWSRNQWKRERYAPCFHLDDENLDPRTWCRFPILSGGFQRELDALRGGAS